MGLQYLDMIRTLGERPSTKWIIPMELTNMARSIEDRLSSMTRASNGQGGGDGTTQAVPRAYSGRGGTADRSSPNSK